MRSSVIGPWLAYVRRWEGVCFWMYLDTKAKVTTGIGFLIDSISQAQAVPWISRATGKRATPSEIAVEWRRVKAQTQWSKLNGLNAVWVNSSKLRIGQDFVDRKLLDMTPVYWQAVMRTLPDLNDFPADAQLAIIDEAWQNGGAYLEVKDRSGQYVWKSTRAALLARDFATAARSVPAGGDRSAFRQRLFRNAAIVQEHDLDPNILWDTKSPSVPTLKGFDMAASEPLYRTNGTDQGVAANEEKTLVVGINDKTKKGDVSIVSGPNAGVDTLVVAIFNCAQPTNVALWLALVDTKTDGSDAKDVLISRAHGKLTFPVGSGWEISAQWKGDIPKHKTAGRQYRLRVRAWANAPILVTLTQYSGWKMP